MSTLRKLGRWTAGVGVGVFVLALAGGRGLDESFAVAVGVVALGWVVWGATALSDEFRRAAAFAAGTAVGMAARGWEAWGGRLQALTVEGGGTRVEGVVLEQRSIRVNEASGTRVMTMAVPVNYERQRMLAFLALGQRAGGFRYRDVRGRRLATGEKMGFSLWRRMTDELAAAGLFLKDQSGGARPAGSLRTVYERVAELPWRVEGGGWRVEG